MGPVRSLVKAVVYAALQSGDRKVQRSTQFSMADLACIKQ